MNKFIVSACGNQIIGPTSASSGVVPSAYIGDRIIFEPLLPTITVQTFPDQTSINDPGRLYTILISVPGQLTGYRISLPNKINKAFNSLEVAISDKIPTNICGKSVTQSITNIVTFENEFRPPFIQSGDVYTLSMGLFEAAETELGFGVILDVQITRPKSGTTSI